MNNRRLLWRGVTLVLILGMGTVLGASGLVGAAPAQAERLDSDGTLASQAAGDAMPGADVLDGEDNQTTTTAPGVAAASGDDEPNDNLTTATEISPGEDVSARLAEDDFDVYEIPLSDGEILNVSVLFDDSDANIQLIAGNPAESEVDVATSSFSETDNESVSMTALSDESYYIVVLSQNNNSADYELRTELAGQVAQGVVTGTVTNETNEPIAGADVRIKDADGQVAAVASTDSYGEYRVDVPGGEYNVTASKAWYEPSTESITVDAGTDTSQDLVLRPGPEANDGYEPNDFFDTASPITAGSYSRLKMVDGESDYYAVTLEEGESITASLGINEQSRERGTDMYFSLYGPDRQSLDHNHSFSENVSVSATNVAESGTYYVVASGPFDRSSPYTLDVAVASPPSDLSAERDIESTELAPGGETTVTVEATALTDSVTVEETFSPAVASASVDSVTVGGDSIDPFILAAESDGLLTVVNDVTPGQTVRVEYTITAAADADIGTAYTVDGTVTSDSEASLEADEITVREGSPLSGLSEQYDADNDGDISLAELSQAATDYTAGDITLAQLGEVSAAYSSG